MGQHSKQVVVLTDLGERTTRHDGKIILIEAEVAAAKEVYGSPAMQDVKLWDLSEAILRALQSKDKENGTTLASGVTSFDVEQMLLYLDSRGEITLPEASEEAPAGKHNPTNA